MYLRYLVIDEADRMMSNISDDWLNVLEAAVYRNIIHSFKHSNTRSFRLSLKYCTIHLNILTYTQTFNQSILHISSGADTGGASAPPEVLREVLKIREKLILHLFMIYCIYKTDNFNFFPL